MTYLGLPVILIFTFPLTQYLIDTIGWRTAWTVLGLVGFAIIVPSSFFLLRRQPEDMGLRPDGGARFEEGASPGKGSQAAEEEYSWTRAEALRSFTFWRLTLAFGLHMMGQQSVSLYRFLHYSDQGVDASIVSFAASAEGLMSIVSALSFAYVVSKLGLNGTAAIGFGFMALSHSLTVIADDPATVTAALMLFGLAVTYLVMAQNLFFPAYFGRRHIGAIRGVSLSVSLTFGAISGPLTGLIAEATNSFAIVWWAGGRHPRVQRLAHRPRQSGQRGARRPPEALYCVDAMATPALPETLTAHVVVDDIAFAEGPTFDREGSLYFVNYQRLGTIGRLTPEGDAIVWVETGGQANGLKHDAQGRIVCADYGGKRVTRFDTQTRAMEVSHRCVRTALHTSAQTMLRLTATATSTSRTLSPAAPRNPSAACTGST